MEYSIEHNEPEGICIVRVSGDHKRPDDSRVLQEVAREIRSETGCNRFLYDMRKAIVSGSTMDTFETGVTPLKEKFERDFRIALVYSGNLDDHRFMENIVVNRGYVLRVFSEIEEATLWLTDGRKTT